MDRPVLDLVKKHKGLTFRGVGVERLATILSTGADVYPTDSIIYCGALEKASEYGPLILAFRHRDEDGALVLQRAVATIRPETAAEEAAALRISHPHVLSGSGEIIRVCRVQPEHQARLNYLRDFGYFVPGDPWRALVGMFLYGSGDELAEAGAVIDRFIKSTA
jgi:hypothetical protein